MAVRYAPTVKSASDDILTHTRVAGGGGVQLHVIEGGNRAGRPFVYYGFSQSWLSWSRQMHSDLANDFRLVALDLRGHGESDKPHDGYSDCLLWADDVEAVIRAWAFSNRCCAVGPMEASSFWITSGNTVKTPSAGSPS